MIILPRPGRRTMQDLRDPMPHLGRMMVFVDGENLVNRFQAMVAEGYVANDALAYERDVFVWNPGSVRPGLHHVVRATYYTYVVGDPSLIAQRCEQIKALEFRQYHVPGQQSTRQLVNTLYPCVFQKFKSKPAKGVDIQMTVDILSNVYQNNLDTVYLISGDGDYKPVIKEAIRFGKQVYVAALSSGLNRELTYIADRFIDLDSAYVKAPPEYEPAKD